MKQFLSLLILLGLLAASCDQETTDSATAQSAQTSRQAESSSRPQEPLPSLPPAVADPKDADRTLGQAALKEVKIEEGEIQLKLKLPPNAEISADPESSAGVKIVADNGTFQMIIQPADIAPEDLPILWENQPPAGKFRRFVVNGRGGILAEIEREGQLDYQVDYHYREGDKAYRIHTPVNESFSQMQATKIFNVCRQIGR